MHCFNVITHLDLDQFSCLFLHSLTNAIHVICNDFEFNCSIVQYEYNRLT